MWIAACLGLTVLLSACFGGGGGELVVAAAPTPEPEYEPAGVEGENAFFTLDEQISASNSAVISLALAEAEAAGLDPLSAITQISLTAPTEEELKSGLYGGSLENTCDPERLIKHLLDNPTQGQVWADVQGISFAEIPDFIRGLDVEILDQDTTVLNHGFDPKGHAIPIVSTLAVGTAVLVDENGDVRVRCYCGNPILPYEPTEYEPRQCLTFFAVVYQSPDDRKRIDGVPRSVRATNNVASYDNVDWKQITWAGQTGWVRADESETRYCKPPDKYECIDAARVTQRPGTELYVGEIEGGNVSVVISDIDGWSLIKFAETSGWIPADRTGGNTCATEVACVTSTSGTWTRPGNVGKQFLAAGRAHRVQFTGQSFVDTGGSYAQVFVTSPSPARVGYVRSADLETRGDAECNRSTLCSLFDVDVPVYQSSSGSATWGTLWFAQVDILDDPVDGRYQIDWGTSTGWVDATHLRGYSGELCTRSACVQGYDVGYSALPPDSGSVSLPAGPMRVDFTGRVHVDGAVTYREFTSPSVGGFSWIEASVGYNTLPWTACNTEPPCNGEVEVCEVRCVADFAGDAWTITGLWEPAGDQMMVDVTWPSPLVGTTLTSPTASPATDRSIPVGVPALASPILLSWSDASTGRSGTVECEVDACDLIGFDGDLGYLSGIPLPDPATCVEVTCQASTMVGNDGVPREEVRVDWSPTTAVMDVVDFDWPAGYFSGTRFDRLSPQFFTQFVGAGGVVSVTWIAEDDQSGVVQCPLAEECDVFDVEFPAADRAECCPDGTIFALSSPTDGECCPSERLTSAVSCCPLGTAVSGADCEVLCPTGTEPLNGSCVPIECPDGFALAGNECIPSACPEPLVDVDGLCVVPTPEPTVESLDPGPTPTPRPQPTATPAPSPTATPEPDPECPYGALPDGRCFVLCAPGELNVQGLCVCSDGYEIDQSDTLLGCQVVCPAGQQRISATECAVVQISCPAGTTRQGSECVPIDCPQGTSLNAAGECVAQQAQSCAPPWLEEGSICWWQGESPEPNCSVLPAPAGVTVRVMRAEPDRATGSFLVTCEYDR